ncbi:MULTISPECIES: nuclear transport factor 2 family protein [unclassified Brenneria]|uniref:nuclear transport factor 2 family protein n=1 Tax=unclassified Brenneria TaxID=2634434 RepID=UPI00155591AE|nr:nuclear transport factor 2 family protein [Brenneria sp. hezel4-2-4]MEE3650987.1 nuclear transport factor 2 family protein [Brenneria sp. HEZEL_4_2_4]NPD00942.1 nuclear transport factor 2 family protein [Brenneria sp. hezel4-2-4]
MSSQQLCSDYLNALNAGDLQSVLSLFTPDAVVQSPLYGSCKVSDFYYELFNDTSRSDTTLLNVFNTSSSSNTIALHFNYKWTFANDEVVNFECVDVFRINKDKPVFESITIIYDTAPIRQQFEKMKVLAHS